MSKNSTLGHSLNTSGKITKDENFKDVIRYKAIAALLVKFTIPEFYNKTLVEISKAIIDTRKRPIGMSDTSILEDEVDFLPTEAGTKDEKNTISDSIFRLRIGGTETEIDMRCIDTEITVNTEMQSVTSESSLKYNLISRAIYYGASLLRDTVPAGDTRYTNIHKVYTIWFCAKKLNLEEYKESKGKFIHRYGFRRFYDDIIDKSARAEKEADLIEVILVELPELRKEDNQTTDMIYKLFFDTSNVVKSIEATEKVNLTKIRKGVTDMIDYETRTQQREADALQAGKIEVAKNLIDSIKEEHKDVDYKDIIKKAASLLKLDTQLISKLESIYVK